MDIFAVFAYFPLTLVKKWQHIAFFPCYMKNIIAREGLQLKADCNIMLKYVSI